MSAHVRACVHVCMWAWACIRAPGALSNVIRGSSKSPTVGFVVDVTGDCYPRNPTTLAVDFTQPVLPLEEQVRVCTCGFAVAGSGHPSGVGSRARHPPVIECFPHPPPPFPEHTPQHVTPSVPVPVYPSVWRQDQLLTPCSRPPASPPLSLPSSPSYAAHAFVCNPRGARTRVSPPRRA